ncbi:hypothetical protein DN752_19930 [Echinicola strongylocentroti]|uniref:Polysaccharide pyruvyl transferase domain-containing protein n=1 Tax=Echinicola strongylocentroti TaxID=1795355 RepID=A0A2Z4IMU7_9BACT|nr:polysaccharide pyruvyl transferase family protein [Echinicola strongylocentroti]AWW32225.1 hypothetical protein DN752_19930 [Echinicola strongylocentroti]
MKIIVKGAYGESNFGDDLLMLVFEEYLNREFKNSQLVFVGREKHYPNNLLKHSKYNLEIHPDVVVYGGGTQFFSFGERKSKKTFLEKLCKAILNPQMIYNFLINKIAPSKGKYSDVPNAFIGFGLGPFKSEIAMLNAKQHMNGSIFIGVRDEVSFNYCNEWGIESHLGADVVFSSYFQIPKLIGKDNAKRKIGVIVRDWKWEESGALYIKRIKEFIEKDSSPVIYEFIVFAPLIDKEWSNYLSERDHLVWDPDIDNVDVFLKKLNEYDGFISARYHGAILGAILGKPTVCIEIEPKLRILCDQVPQLELWKKPFDISELTNIIANLNYEIDYTWALAERRKMADDMLDLFGERLSKEMLKS